MSYISDMCDIQGFQEKIKNDEGDRGGQALRIRTIEIHMEQI